MGSCYAMSDFEPFNGSSSDAFRIKSHICTHKALRGWRLPTSAHLCCPILFMLPLVPDAPAYLSALRLPTCQLLSLFSSGSFQGCLFPFLPFFFLLS